MVKAKNNVIKPKKKTPKKVENGVKLLRTTDEIANDLIKEEVEKSLAKTSKDTWLKKLWYRLKYIFTKTELDDEINEVLYWGSNTMKKPQKTVSSDEHNPSFSDKLKWFGHNLFHCNCSDNKEESCDVDIDEIIKNNSLEQIEKDEEALYNNPNWDRNKLILYKSKK